MDGDLDMTRVNSAERNPASLGADARNHARRGVAPPSGHVIASQEQSGSCLKLRLRPAERPLRATPLRPWKPMAVPRPPIGG